MLPKLLLSRWSARSFLTIAGYALWVFGALAFAELARAETAASCEVEPTDMTISYGALIDCDIDIVGDTDVFRFQGSAGELVVAQGTMLGFADSEIELFDPDGALVDSDSGFRVAQVRVTLAKSGTYTLLMKERDDDEISSFTLALERISPPSPGSPRMIIGTETTAGIDAQGDLDLYNFEAASAEAVVAQVTMHGFSDSQIELFDPDGFLLDLDSAFIDARIDAMLAKTGVYSLLIKERDDDEVDFYTLALERVSECRGLAVADLSNETVSTTKIVEACNLITAGNGYQITTAGDVTFLTAGTVELGSGFAVQSGGSFTADTRAWGTPIDFGNDLQRTLIPVGDMAVFRFPGQAGETLVANLTLHNFADSQIEVYDPDGFLLASDSGFRVARVNADLTETGSHSILVKERDDDETGDFTLVLERLTPPSPAARDICFGCELSDTVAPLGDIDLFTFAATGGETLAAQMTMFGFSDAQIELYDPDGILIISDSAFSTASINTTLTKPGVHSLLVKERDDDETDSYNVSLQCLAGCPPP